MKFFTYWEGKKTPYIELCYETMKRHIPDIIRLDENTAGYYVDLPPEYYRIKEINHRVDYLKAKLIHKYGGFWLDADTIVMKPLTEDLYYQKEYVGCPGFFGAPKGSKELERWIEHMDVVIRKKSKFQWAELILPMVWKDNKHDEVRGIDRKLLCPFYGELIREVFFKDKQELGDRADNSFVIVLYNYVFPEWFKKATRKEILDGNMIISELFRKSLYGETINRPIPLEDVTLSNVANKLNEIIKYIRYKGL